MESKMTKKQSEAATGKRRGPYNLSAPPNYGGRGKDKCAICGNPTVEHESFAFCSGGTDR